MYLLARLFAQWPIIEPECITDINKQTKHSRMRLKCGGTCAETKIRLSAKRKSPFKSAGTRGVGGSVQSTTGRRAVHTSLQGSYCSCKPVFCSHVTLTGYPLHSPVSPTLLHQCVTVCHHISNAVHKTEQNNSSYNCKRI
jgi:hypothetical protein